MTASNNDVLSALANVIECRSHRRGRKPQWNIIIFTDEKGTVRIVDLITECKAVVGKRAYKKRAEKAPANEGVKECIRRKYAKQQTVVEVKDVPSDVRISPRTGKPVRPYKKKDDTIKELKNKELKNKIETFIDSANDVKQESIDSLKELLTQAKLGLTGAETTGNKTLINLFTKNIEDIKTRLSLLGVNV